MLEKKGSEIIPSSMATITADDYSVIVDCLKLDGKLLQVRSSFSQGALRLVPATKILLRKHKFNKIDAECADCRKCQPARS